MSVTPTAAASRDPLGQGCVLGIDIGTTGAKAIAFDAAGAPLARAYRDYPLLVGPGGTAELEAHDVLAALRHILCDVAAEVEAAGCGPVRAVATAAQGEAVTPVDGGGQPVGRSILTFDRRGEAGRTALAADGWEARTEATGMPLSWIVTAAKLAWLRRDDPAAFAGAAAFLCYEDLLVAQLTGTAVISDSLAQRTWLLDRRRRAWDAAALADLGLTGRTAQVAAMGAAVGQVCAPGSAAFGLPRGCLVVAGAHDQTAALIGAGAVRPGMAAHSTGTVDCLSLTLADGPAAPLTARGYGVGLHPLPGLAVTLAFGFGGGSLLSWWQKIVGGTAIGELLAEVPLHPGGPFAVPFWAGSGTPDLDAGDLGALFGLTLDADRAALTAALLRGMAYEGRRNLAVLTSLGVDVTAIRLVGGGARDPRWSQLRADATDRSYTEMPLRDAGCLGAAILAAVGCGMHPDLTAACEAMVHTARTFEPDPGRVAAHRAGFAAYCAAVSATRSVRAAQR